MGISEANMQGIKFDGRLKAERQHEIKNYLIHRVFICRVSRKAKMRLVRHGKSHSEEYYIKKLVRNPISLLSPSSQFSRSGVPYQTSKAQTQVRELCYNWKIASLEVWVKNVRSEKSGRLLWFQWEVFIFKVLRKDGLNIPCYR